MRVIWINPVVRQMYDHDCLHRFLEKHGYRQAECRSDWGEKVRQEYGKAAQTTKLPVADVRCPEVEKLLRGTYEGCGVVVPKIEPILIHCAREISGRRELQGIEKVITTPCQSLADMGNALKLQDTSFVSWKRFLQEVSDAPKGRQLEKSPIPPGFFQPLGCPVTSVTGEASIRDYLQKRDYGKARLIEMLMCEGGCHHGDGVIGCGGTDWNDTDWKNTD